MSTPPAQPSEEELRAAYEAELSRISSSEMILQTVVSLLNIGARRMGLLGSSQEQATAEVDLEQVRDSIDAVRALLPIVERSEPQQLRPLRDALSQLQMAYAQAAPAASSSPTPEAPPAKPQGTGSTPEKPSAKDDPGPAEASGRLWVPGR